MRLRPTICALALAVATAAALPAAASPASARPVPATGPEHCVVEVVGQLDTGQLLVGPMRCSTGDTGPMQAASLATTSYIATHFDGAGYTGDSLAIEGTACNGGWLNLPIAWRNRISSTFSGCSVRHYDGLNLTGVSQTTTPSAGNLTTLNNAADSVKYG